MKTILAYGDSLTWGYDVTNRRRHAYEDRWPSVLEAGLAGKARVVAEGLNGRTTMFDWPGNWDNKNGASLLPSLLETHRPLDLVIIALGGNDINPWVGRTAADAAVGMRQLVSLVRSMPDYEDNVPTDVLIVAPYPIDPLPGLADDKAVAHAREQSLLFAAEYREVAVELGTGFLDLAPVARTDPTDGVHLDAPGTRAVGLALVPVVLEMLGRQANARAAC